MGSSARILEYTEGAQSRLGPSGRDIRGADIGRRVGGASWNGGSEDYSFGTQIKHNGHTSSSGCSVVSFISSISSPSI